MKKIPKKWKGISGVMFYYVDDYEFQGEAYVIYRNWDKFTSKDVLNITKKSLLIFVGYGK